VYVKIRPNIDRGNSANPIGKYFNSKAYFFRWRVLNKYKELWTIKKER
jgi:hypothetical protein